MVTSILTLTLLPFFICCFAECRWGRFNGHMHNDINTSGGVVVYLEYSLDSHAESPGSNLTIAVALLSFSNAIYPHCCSRPRCINGDPVGCYRLLCLNLPAQRHYHRLLYEARNAPRGVEIVHCKCSIEMYPMTGVITCCKRFGPLGKSAYKNLLLFWIWNRPKAIFVARSTRLICIQLNTVSVQKREKWDHHWNASLCAADSLITNGRL